MNTFCYVCNQGMFYFVLICGCGGKDSYEFSRTKSRVSSR